MPTPNDPQSISVIPAEAVNYLANKKLKPSFSYLDVWHEEHAHAFTVAKSTGFNILTDTKKAIDDAITEGKTLTQFQKELTPTLQKQGWWGTKQTTDPLTGEKVTAKLGSPRRLKVIYETNLNQAYQAGIWERTQKSNIITHYIYRIGPSQRHREDHLSWDGLTLPKDDAFWSAHWPINGYNCKCTARGITPSTYKKYQKTGVTDLTDIEQGGGVRSKKPITTTAPTIKTTTFTNKRTGQTVNVPEGVHADFMTNAGKDGRHAVLTSDAYGASQVAFSTVKGRSDNLKQIFKGPANISYAETFTREALDSTVNNTGKLLGVGYLENQEFLFLKKKGLNPNGTIVVEDKTIAIKQTKTRGRTTTATALTEKEWASLPLIIQEAEEVWWDEQKQNLLYLKKTDVKDEAIRIAIEPNFTSRKKNTTAIYESVRTAFKVNIRELETSSNFEKIR